MHFNKKYPWDGVDVMSKFTGREVWIYPDVDGIDVMSYFYAGEVWASLMWELLRRGGWGLPHNFSLGILTERGVEFEGLGCYKHTTF